ncbi:hypothetical protein BJF79_13570 [Actinomadura sp. CNU-125]|nr:hypothetical protein BJF79_13570 [Actinomadura sp. CNU-125]
MAFTPLSPVTTGHILVVPREHVPDFAASPAVSAIAMSLAAELADGMGPVNLITSRGAEATQTVRHLHLHLVPRREDDGLLLPWSPR